jgi:hypothetical protein
VVARGSGDAVAVAGLVAGPAAARPVAELVSAAGRAVLGELLQPASVTAVAASAAADHMEIDVRKVTTG